MMMRRGRPPQEHGFTLVEVLVVIVILGILVAVALPVLLGQRQRAADVTVKSDLRIVAGAVEAIRAEDSELSEAALREGLRLSPGTVVTVYESSSGQYCLVGSKESGAQGTQSWTYSGGSGLGDRGIVSCPGTPTFELP